jgi:predicted RND superfamily exporter protein
MDNPSWLRNRQVPGTRIAGFLLAARWPLLLLALLLTACCLVPSRRLAFDRSIENMFAPDDPLLPPYRRLKRTFGGNEIVLAVYRDPELMDASGAGTRRVAEISRELKKTPGVRDVLSLAELDVALGKMAPVAAMFGFGGQPPEGIVDPESNLAKRFLSLFEGYTHGPAGDTGSVVCMLDEPRSSGVSRQETIDQLRQKIEELADGFVAGEPVMVADGFRCVEEDGKRLGWVSTLLLSVILLFCFRSLRWIVLAVAVVQLALLATRSILVVSGMRLSMVSSMLTAIVTVVGVATVVHIIVRFRAARQAGLSPRESFVLVAGLLAAPVFWACTTDAAGFASLLVANVGPVRDFGLMMTIGALMVLVSVTLLVAGLSVIGPHPTSVRTDWGDRLLDRPLTGSVAWLRRRPKTTLAVVLAVVSVIAAGAYRLELETDFTKNFRAASSIVRSYDMVETKLGSAGIWDIIIPAPEVLNSEYMQRVQKLEWRLRQEVTDPSDPTRPAVKALSLADAVWAAAPTLHRVRSRFKQNLAVRGAVNAMQAHLPVFAAALHGEDPQSPGKYYFRIMLRSDERQSAAEKRHLIDTVTRIAREEFPEAEVTGFFVLLASLIESIVRDQWLAFAVAVGGIGAAMLLAFRHPLYAAIALVPNALPILMVTGLMGWLGLRINMGAAMIAAVSMGLSVDSSIHYIAFFLRARAAGQSVPAALTEVQRSVGRAMVLSTLALVAGFAVLSTSEFVPTVYFGVLVSLAMLGGLAGNLIILPLLLYQLVPEKKNSPAV